MARGGAFQLRACCLCITPKMLVKEMRKSPAGGTGLHLEGTPAVVVGGPASSAEVGGDLLWFGGRYANGGLCRFACR